MELRRGAPDGPLVATAGIPRTVQFERVAGPEGFGNALRLNGPSPHNYVDVPPGIASDLNEFTIAAWVNRATLSGQQWSRVFDFGTGGNTNMSLTIHGGTGAPRYAIRNLPQTGVQDVNAPATAQVPANAWTHVAVTYQGTTATIHINGVAVASNSNITLKPSDLGVTDRNWIGRSQFANDPFLNATVDEFQIFDRALSPAELGTLVDAPGGGELGGGNVAWYRFDEERGETVTDSSGQGRHGAVVLSATAPIPFTDVTVDLAGASGTGPLYLVFPQGEARVNWLEFQRPPGFRAPWAPRPPG